MPSSPIDSPLKTLVIMKAMPCTVPTCPLALSRWPSGTSRVTVVDRAILRRLSTTPPSRITPANAQKTGPFQSTRRCVGNSRYNAPASMNMTRVIALDATMTACLRW